MKILKPSLQSTKNLHIKIFIRLTSGYKNLWFDKVIEFQYKKKSTQLRGVNWVPNNLS